MYIFEEKHLCLYIDIFLDKNIIFVQIIYRISLCSLLLFQKKKHFNAIEKETQIHVHIHIIRERDYLVRSQHCRQENLPHHQNGENTKPIITTTFV